MADDAIGGGAVGGGAAGGGAVGGGAAGGGDDPLMVVPPGRAFLHDMDLSQLTRIQRGFVLGIRHIERELLPGASPEEIREAVAECFPPHALFNEDLADLPSVYRDLRNWLAKKGAGLGVHPSRRIIPLIADRLYANDDDKELARELAKQLLPRGGRRAAPAQATGGDNDAGGRMGGNGGGSSGGGNPHGLAHYMSMRFKDDAKKFAGTEEQALHEYVSGYQQAARDYNLDNEQKLLYVHHLFAGEAKRHYDTHVEGRFATFSEVIQAMSEEYNSSIRQTAVKNKLTYLRLSHFVGQGQTEMQALGNLHRTITKMAPQLPLTHRGDAYKVDFLRAAVIGAVWAIEPLGRIATCNLTYHSLYNELVAALQLHTETRAASTGELSVRGATAATDLRLRPAAVNYTGQGMYANPSKAAGATGGGEWPKNGGTSARGGGVSVPGTPARGGGAASGGTKFDPLSVAGCFNCDNPTHTMRNCPLPVNAIKAAQRKLAYYNKKGSSIRAPAAAVLFQLCCEVNQALEGATAPSPGGTHPEGGEEAAGPNAANDDVACFEAMLVAARHVGGAEGTADDQGGRAQNFTLGE